MFSSHHKPVLFLVYISSTGQRYLKLFYFITLMFTYEPSILKLLADFAFPSSWNHCEITSEGMETWPYILLFLATLFLWNKECLFFCYSRIILSLSNLCLSTDKKYFSSLVLEIE